MDLVTQFVVCTVAIEAKKASLAKLNPILSGEKDVVQLAVPFFGCW